MALWLLPPCRSDGEETIKNRRLVQLGWTPDSDGLLLGLLLDPWRCRLTPPKYLAFSKLHELHRALPSCCGENFNPACLRQSSTVQGLATPQFRNVIFIQSWRITLYGLCPFRINFEIHTTPERMISPSQGRAATYRGQHKQNKRGQTSISSGIRTHKGI
jgi:hypothetical protein